MEGPSPKAENPNSNENKWKANHQAGNNKLMKISLHCS
jgi:hypothetical protein